MYTVPLIVGTVWLVFLSLAFFGIFFFFRRLTKGIKKEDLIKVLEKILKTQAQNSQDLALVEKEIARLKVEGEGHVQKVGMVRFNPFSETGGEHSFALALLDGRDCGVVVTCLHSRERTRMYLKLIKSGKCSQELSIEEKKALKVAQEP